VRSGGRLRTYFHLLVDSFHFGIGNYDGSWAARHPLFMGCLKSKKGENKNWVHVDIL